MKSRPPSGDKRTPILDFVSRPGGADLWKRLQDGGSWTLAWLGGAVIATIVLVAVSFVSLDPGQVAVMVNNVTGAQSTVVQTGLIFRAPFGLQSVYIVDARPQTFVLKGDRNIDELHVVELTVRAADGSNLLFKDTAVIFEVIGEQAPAAIRDSGAEDGFRSWLKPYARSILRDEFGRESTISVSNPTNFGAAIERARVRLNEALEPHGIRVTQIMTPKPRFSEDYENMIEARNEADNQLAVIESELERAKTQRRSRMAEVERDQNRLMQEKRAELEAALATAVTEQTNTVREADAYRIESVAKGQAVLSAASRQAEELRGQLQAEYNTRRSEVDAFSTQPIERVMERLGAKLKGVTIDIQPWAEDANPSRIQYETVGGAP